MRRRPARSILWPRGHDTFAAEQVKGTRTPRVLGVDALDVDALTFHGSPELVRLLLGPMGGPVPNRADIPDFVRLPGVFCDGGGEGSEARQALYKWACLVAGANHSPYPITQARTLTLTRRGKQAEAILQIVWPPGRKADV